MREITSPYFGKSVLVTGGRGFIGAHLVKELIELGAQVRITRQAATKKSYDDIEMGSCVEVVTANLLSLTECLGAVDGVDIIFHLAADARGAQESTNFPSTIYFNNLSMALNMLEAAKRERIQWFLLASSNNVYSQTAKLPFNESDGFLAHPNYPYASYGWAKRASELGAKYLFEETGINVSITRISNTYGPGLSLSRENMGVVASLIKKVYEATESINVWGDGAQIRSFIYVKDVVNALLLIAQNGRSAEPINVSSGEKITVKELAFLIARLFEKKVSINFEPTRQNGIPAKIEDNEKLRKTYGWRQIYTLEQGLLRTIEWYKTKIGSIS